ncbi:MAG: ImcF-related family protein [Pseudomonadota bacterium]
MISDRRLHAKSQNTSRSAELTALASRIFALAEKIPITNGITVEDCAAACRREIESFEIAATKAGYDQIEARAARSGLEITLNAAARRNSSIDPLAWRTAVYGRVFSTRDPSLAHLRDLISKAEGGGGQKFQQIKKFLMLCLEKSTHRTVSIKPKASGLRTIGGIAMLLAVLGIAWIVSFEWSRQSTILSKFYAVHNANVPFLADELDHASRKLDSIRSAVEHAREELATIPVRIIAPLGFRDVSSLIRDDYATSVEKVFTNHLPKALDLSMATEGLDVGIYDNLRVLAMVTGETEWEPAFIAGWLEDHAKDIPGLAGLAHHVDAVDPILIDIDTFDPVLLRQTREFAEAASEPDRAFLELKRNPSIRNLPGWNLQGAVPAAEDIFVRASGADIRRPIAGLYTAAGWQRVRDYTTGAAITKARDVADQLFAEPLPRDIDPAAKLLRLLQQESNEVWAVYLSDLRVRAFDDRETALLVSSRLGGRDSPLVALIESVWTEVGGRDQRRSYENQIAIASAFGPLIRYVEQGQVEDIRRLFADLNFALLAEESTGNLATKASSEKILTYAPALIRQIVDDVISQSVVVDQDATIGPLVREWRGTIGIRCEQFIESRYPFRDGPDARFNDVSALFSPGGLIDGVASRLEELIDKSGPVWRWKPQARLAGLHPASVRFLQDAETISSVLFPEGVTDGTPITFTTVAQNGKPHAQMGGSSSALGIDGAPVTMVWPGTDPAAGFKLTIDTAIGRRELADPGPWGFFRMAERSRWRPRDEGRRFLWYLRTDGGSVVLDLDFNTTPNLLSVWDRIRGLECPKTL